MKARVMSFLPDKPIIHPFAGEGVVSYGNRLLWHQLALQLNEHSQLMLTDAEYVQVVTGYYPDATKRNVKKYLGYFNRSGRGNSMGFRNSQPLPVQLNPANWIVRRKLAARTPAKKTQVEKLEREGRWREYSCHRQNRIP